MRKPILLIFSLTLAVLLIIPFSTLVLALQNASPPHPAYIQTAGDAITVDGDIVDWNVNDTDYFADMYHEGDPARATFAKLYLRYDCDTNTLYALVIPEAGIEILTPDEEAFIKIKGDKLVGDEYDDDGNAPDFSWINENEIEGTADGWEASAKIGPGIYTQLQNQLDVHTQVHDGKEQQTAAVEGRDIPLIAY